MDSNDCGRSPNIPAEAGNRADPKDVKYADRSGNVYENKGSTGTMTDNFSGFCARFASFLQEWTTIHRSSWRKMQRLCTNRGQAETKIGSAVHRPIEPSAGDESFFRWPDEPTSDDPNLPPFHYVPEKKRVNDNEQESCKVYIIENNAVS